MPDTLIFADPGTGKSLVRHSDPVQHRTEWVLVSEDRDEVVLRWLGTPLQDARLEPAFRIEGPRAVFEWNAVEKVLASLAVPWGRPQVLQRWLEECQKWLPEGDLDGELWSFSISKAMFPWLSELDPWLALKTLTVPLELAPFFQAATLPEGLMALGLDPSQSRLVAVVENDTRAFLASGLRDERHWDNLMAAVRFHAWLDVDDLLEFWDRPPEDPTDFLMSLDRHKPDLFQKLRDSYPQTPSVHPWSARLQLPRGWSEVRRLVSEYRAFPDFRWPSQLHLLFEVSKEGWTSQFPRTPKLVLNWRGIRVKVQENGLTVGFVQWDMRGRVVHSEGVSEKERAWLFSEVAKLRRD